MVHSTRVCLGSKLCGVRSVVQANSVLGAGFKLCVINILGSIALKKLESHDKPTAGLDHDRFLYI